MMDNVTYEEACSKTDSQLAKLRLQRKKLLNDDEDERNIDEIRQLRNELKSAPQAILVFDQALFDLIVERVIVEDNDKLTYLLKSGIRLKEEIAWN